MMDLLRQEIAAEARLLVVKVGTRVLTTPSGQLDEARVATLAEDLHATRASGRKVVLVSSGAVGAGMGRLQIATRPTDVARLQAVAAVGQSYLVQAYDRALHRLGSLAAQVLLTAEDLNDRTRYLNVRNTLLRLLELGAIPVINENDTVSVEELATTFGDNDHLAAMVTNLLRAPLLILLSDVNGLYDGDPADPSSQVISTVTHLDDSVLALARDGAQELSKGGMASKLAAARMATAAGENVIIANGHQANIVSSILHGDTVGTLITAQRSTVASRKRWIGFTARPKGNLRLDEGAVRAVREQGRSLLPIGLVQVTGEFEKGDVVSLRDAQGTEIARGLTNYAAQELARIVGLRTEQITGVLGHCPYHEVVHRDNLALTG